MKKMKMPVGITTMKQATTKFTGGPPGDVGGNPPSVPVTPVQPKQFKALRLKTG